MLEERGIDEEWVIQAVSDPARTMRQDDGTTHYLKPIRERGGRVIRVVANLERSPPQIITAFFDRRLKGEL